MCVANHVHHDQPHSKGDRVDSYSDNSPDFENFALYLHPNDHRGITEHAYKVNKEPKDHHLLEDSAHILLGIVG